MSERLSETKSFSIILFTNRSIITIKYTVRVLDANNVGDNDTAKETVIPENNIMTIVRAFVVFP
jgi:hypothetical protein